MVNSFSFLIFCSWVLFNLSPTVIIFQDRKMSGRVMALTRRKYRANISRCRTVFLAVSRHCRKALLTNICCQLREVRIKTFFRMCRRSCACDRARSN